MSKDKGARGQLLKQAFLILAAILAVALAASFFSGNPSGLEGAALRLAEGAAKNAGSKGELELSFSKGAEGKTLFFNGTDGFGTEVFGEITEEPDEAAGKAFVLSKASLIMSVFVPKASPYPGTVTREIICPENSWPKEALLSENERTLILRAGRRMNYGVCIEEDWKYNSTYTAIFCPNSRVRAEVRVFSERPLDISVVSRGIFWAC